MPTTTPQDLHRNKGPFYPVVKAPQCMTEQLPTVWAPTETITEIDGKVRRRLRATLRTASRPRVDLFGLRLTRSRALIVLFVDFL